MSGGVGQCRFSPNASYAPGAEPVACVAPAKPPSVKKNIQHGAVSVGTGVAEKVVGTASGFAASKAVAFVEREIAFACERSSNPFMSAFGYVLTYATSLVVGATFEVGLGSALDEASGKKIDAASIKRRAILGTSSGLIGRFLTPIKAEKTLPPAK